MIHGQVERSFIVGASIPNEAVKVVMVSWPFIRLDFTSDELSLTFRSTWIRGLARFTSIGSDFHKDQGLTFWRTRLRDITIVRIAGRSMLIRSGSGDCGIGIPFFAPGGQRTWDLIKKEVGDRHAPIELVSSNFRAMRSMR